jgi:hypothetical protein
MKILNLLIFIQISLCSCSQHNCNTLVLLKYNGKAPLLKGPNGDIEFLISNDTIKEDYYILNILRTKENFAFVKASSVLYDTVPKYGWIEIRFLGIYVNNYSEPVVLYSQPSETSSITATFDNPCYEMLQILGCEEKWLLVNFNKGESTFQGWLPFTRQCSNPYSTCN